MKTFFKTVMGFCAALLLVLVCGCEMAGVVRARRVQQMPEVVVLTGELRLLDKPCRIAEDYSFPSGHTSQIFTWKGRREATWRILMGPDRYSYAGIQFQRPLDFSGNRERYALKFRMTPSGASEHLSIGLVGGEPVPLLAEIPLGSCRVTRRGAWDYFTVPLAAFESQGRILASLNADVADTPADFDWARVEGLRFTTLAGRRPFEDFVVSNLRFARVRAKP